ncbi:MAG TPA: hypothetical protein ENK26_02460 [Gammaproteobacteria bacterium]|nr:hypothetical protein [Gammaproteobacteria bacterium]
MILIPALLILLAPCSSAWSMGLRSLVALPVEKAGTVVRLQVERAGNADRDTLVANAAYGISARQTVLMGIPWRLSPAGDNRLGDFSALYRQMLTQNDHAGGTDRLGLLGGAVVPTDNNRDFVLQGGLVYTRFVNRHEFDVDALYQAGLGDRNDSGRYDLSWQYRLTPSERPLWGIASEINSVLEWNGRWREGNDATQQMTAGLQWVHARWVLEGGVVKDLNNAKETRYLVSSRFHF